MTSPRRLEPPKNDGDGAFDEIFSNIPQSPLQMSWFGWNFEQFAHRGLTETLKELEVLVYGKKFEARGEKGGLKKR